MKQNNAPIYGLDDFGLNLQTLTSLGKRPIRLHISFKPLEDRKLFSLSPTERKAKLTAWYQQSLRAVQHQWPASHSERLGTKDRPHGLRGRIAAEKVPMLRRIPQIGHIWIDTIPGVKRKKLPVAPHWFAVQARFAIQVEGQTRGTQHYEDRVVLVRASSAKVAQHKLRPSFKDYGQPYLNSDGYQVRWAFEAILGVYELLADEIDPKGTEVFSVIGGRRMKPEYQWHSKHRPSR